MTIEFDEVDGRMYPVNRQAEKEAQEIEEIEVLLDQYSAMKAEFQPAIDQLDNMAAEIKSRVLALGQEVSYGNVSVTLRASYQKESWDSKALAGYAVVHPEIEQLKKVTTVQKAAVIKVK